MFRDLPLVSIQRKVARERVHHVNVRMMLMRRRVLRDFIRAYASFVQEQIAIREVVKLLRKKREVRLMRISMDAFKCAQSDEYETKLNRHEFEIGANIAAWHRHFFRQRAAQRRIASTVPITQ